MSLHMNIHGGMYKCSECGRCCRDSSELAVHRRSHLGEKPFECTVCGKRFTQSGNFVSHSRIHSGEKPYKCHLCDKAFSESGNLNRHMRAHTGEKPHKCSLCDKSFSDSSSLQRHKRRVHSSSRPYDCRYCGKLFKSSIELKCHVRIHTAEVTQWRYLVHVWHLSEEIQPQWWPQDTRSATWSRMFAVNVVIVQQQPNWVETSSSSTFRMQKLSCGLCGCSNEKRTVKEHFKKCSAEHGLTGVLL